MFEAIKRAKLSTNATTLGIIVAGLVYLGFTFNRDPASGAAQLLPVLGAMVGAIKLIRQGDVVEAKADAAKEQSQQNGEQLATIDTKVDGAVVKVDRTHDAVNGEMAKFRADLVVLSDMKVELATLIAEARGNKQGRSDLISDTNAMAVAVVHDPSADQAPR
jgi:hypothetical protein